MKQNKFAKIIIYLFINTNKRVIFRLKKMINKNINWELISTQYSSRVRYLTPQHLRGGLITYSRTIQ